MATAKLQTGQARRVLPVEEKEVRLMYLVPQDVWLEPFRFVPVQIFPGAGIAAIAVLIFLLRHRASKNRH